LILVSLERLTYIVVPLGQAGEDGGFVPIGPSRPRVEIAASAWI
jgi:hypothetical protein